MTADREPGIPERLISGVVEDTVPSLGHRGGIRLIATTRPLEANISNPLIASINTVWNTAQFEVAREPLRIGTVASPTEFSAGPSLHISDMPIKAPGDAWHLLPTEIASLQNVVQSCIDFETSVNPRYVNDYYAYLTLQRSLVEQGGSMRGGVPHSDSIQGPRIQPKRPIEHGYLATDSDPPRFFVHGFNLNGLNSDHHNIAEALAVQADPANTVTIKEFGIYFFDAYCVHEAAAAAEEGVRTFFRLTISTREFDRLGNTRNELLDLDWPLVPRPIGKFHASSA